MNFILKSLGCQQIESNCVVWCFCIFYTTAVVIKLFGHASKQGLISFVVEFCNEWPKVLSTDEICDKLFPVEVITRDIVADGASLRDPRARVVTIQVIRLLLLLTVSHLVEIAALKSQHECSNSPSIVVKG